MTSQKGSYEVPTRESLAKVKVIPGKIGNLRIPGTGPNLGRLRSRGDL